MARKDGSGGGSARGFASMDDDRKKQIASQGGLASARGKNTSNRGFASMDKDRQRQISSMGGKASKGVHGHRREGNDEDVESDIVEEKNASEQDLTSLESEDERVASEQTRESLAYSETDEDEDEGLGDGNLGRSTRGDVTGD